MSQSEKPFTVSDKRHFTPEGRPREDGGSVAASETAQAEAPAGDARAKTTETNPPRGPAGLADFSQFVAGLAAQAGVLLSGEGLPEGVDAREARDGARSVIGILEMLKGKTVGNLSEAEAGLLDEILFQLRMAYVEKTRSGGA